MTRKESFEKWGDIKIEQFTSFSLLFRKEFCDWEQTKEFEVLINISEADDISERQENELKAFWNNSKDYFERSKKEIWNYIKLDRENGNHLVPKNLSENIPMFVVPKSISLTRDGDDNPTCLCLLFDYKFDDEGICVMFRNGEIVETGSQDLLVC